MKGKTVTESYVTSKIWFGSDGYNDEYLVVREIQVMESNGFKKGDKVRVTIENIEEVKNG